LFLLQKHTKNSTPLDAQAYSGSLFLASLNFLVHSFFHRDSRQKKKRASRVFVAKKKKRASRVCQLAHGMPFGALPESFAKK